MSSAACVVLRAKRLTQFSGYLYVEDLHDSFLWFCHVCIFKYRRYFYISGRQYCVMRTGSFKSLNIEKRRKYIKYVIRNIIIISGYMTRLIYKQI